MGKILTKSYQTKIKDIIQLLFFTEEKNFCHIEGKGTKKDCNQDELINTHSEKKRIDITNPSFAAGLLD